MIPISSCFLCVPLPTTEMMPASGKKAFLIGLWGRSSSSRKFKLTAVRSGLTKARSSSDRWAGAPFYSTGRADRSAPTPSPTDAGGKKATAFNGGRLCPKTNAVGSPSLSSRMTLSCGSPSLITCELPISAWSRPAQVKRLSRYSGARWYRRHFHRHSTRRQSEWLGRRRGIANHSSQHSGHLHIRRGSRPAEAHG